MKKARKDIVHYFREILGTLSISEIMSNDSLIHRAKRVEHLIMSRA